MCKVTTKEETKDDEGEATISTRQRRHAAYRRGKVEHVRGDECKSEGCCQAHMDNCVLFRHCGHDKALEGTAHLLSLAPVCERLVGLTALRRPDWSARGGRRGKCADTSTSCVPPRRVVVAAINTR